MGRGSADIRGTDRQQTETLRLLLARYVGRSVLQ
jgi:hypothetical protein